MRFFSGPFRQAGMCLAFRPPYDWEGILAFLSIRAIPGVESVREGEYLRTVRLSTETGRERVGWMRVRILKGENALHVRFSASLLPALPRLRRRVSHLFDLACDPERVHLALAKMETWRPGIYVPGVRIPGCFDGFEMAVRAILGQQITVKAATTLAGRLARNLGCPVHTGMEGLRDGFPTPQSFLPPGQDLQETLGAMGIISARARAIHALAEAIAKGAVSLKPSDDPESTMRFLVSLPGIGQWTAGYVAMRALGWKDAFLDTDYGIRKAMHPLSAAEMKAVAEPWRPWRSYAMQMLWRTLAP